MDLTWVYHRRLLLARDVELARLFHLCPNESNLVIPHRVAEGEKRR